MVWIGKWVQVPHIFHKIPSARAHRQNKLQIRMKLSCIYHGMIVFLFKGGDNISNRNYTTLGLNHTIHTAKYQNTPESQTAKENIQTLHLWWVMDPQHQILMILNRLCKVRMSQKAQMQQAGKQWSINHSWKQPDHSTQICFTVSTKSLSKHGQVHRKDVYLEINLQV